MSADSRHHRARSGPIVAGTWLIALGLVVVIHDAADMTWAEGWPLFVIAVGCATLTTSLLGQRRLGNGAWSLLWGVGWIVVGGVLLASTTGNLDTEPIQLVSRWWPVALIAVGVWFLVASVWPTRSQPVESLTIPLAGAPAAEVRISFGAGELSVGRAPAGLLLSGTFQGGVVYRSPGPGFVEIKPDTGHGWPMSGESFRWQVGVTGETPLDLRLDTGASRASIDLSELLVRRLDLRSGASDTRVRLPRAAGVTAVRAESGVASLHLEVPEGVAARIRSRMALGRTTVNESRFPRTIDGYASPDFMTAPHRVDIEVQGGVGSTTIR